MKILMVYPRYPDTFWSFRYALKFIGKKAAFPPLGLLTVAAMLPGGWEVKLVDLNVAELKDRDIKWAELVFIGAMEVQRESAEEIIKRVGLLGKKIVAGGPLFTFNPDQFQDRVHHLVLDEAEVTLPLFLADLEKGMPQSVYSSTDRPQLIKTPLPMWSLINMKHYSTMNIQYSRGCPYDCEFCDIKALSGSKIRTKTAQQMQGELDVLYRLGWRGTVLIVDDNFIGNKNKLKTQILPVLISWQQRHGHPFDFLTESSIELADDTDLMKLMTSAGFSSVFVGIESPNEASLEECNKEQNKGRDLVESVIRIQQHGLEVKGGFILGFDNDPDSIFDEQIALIKKSSIVVAMVGLLNAPRVTRLYQRLQKEGRILKQNFSGDNTDLSMNFVPRMNRDKLMAGYNNVMGTIYSAKQYYQRISSFVKIYKPQKIRLTQFRWHIILGGLNCFWRLGILDRGRMQYWRMCIPIFFKKPRMLAMALTLSVHAYHFRKVTEKGANA
jgi:radical SAM superfamily enzyme YgiQ (UPF0313 family)